MLLLYFVVAGLLIGRIGGGRLSGITGIQFRWWALALAGLAFQALLFAAPVASRVGDAGPALYVVSTLAVLAALLRNLALPGFVVIAFGAFLNLVVIVANGGGMPSPPDVWLALNDVANLPTTDFSNAVLAGPDTRLAFLGDIFVLPRPLPLANVFSIGDVLIGLGAATFLVRAMHASTAPEAHTTTPSGEASLPLIPAATETRAAPLPLIVSGGRAAVDD